MKGLAFGAGFVVGTLALGLLAYRSVLVEPSGPVRAEFRVS